MYLGISEHYLIVIVELAYDDPYDGQICILIVHQEIHVPTI